jgi:hypothetical protein
MQNEIPYSEFTYSDAQNAQQSQNPNGEPDQPLN